MAKSQISPGEGTSRSFDRAPRRAVQEWQYTALQTSTFVIRRNSFKLNPTGRNGMWVRVQNQRIARVSRESVSLEFARPPLQWGRKKRINPRTGESRMQINAVLVYLARTCNGIPNNRLVSNLARQKSLTLYRWCFVVLRVESKSFPRHARCKREWIWRP